MVITITNRETEAWKAYLTFSELSATKVAKQRHFDSKDHALNHHAGFPKEHQEASWSYSCWTIGYAL